MKSLIQQRMDINRVRTNSFVYFAIAASVIPLGLFQLSSSENPVLAWVQVLAGLALLVSGLVILARFRRQIREFEREHGVGAGKQTPLA